MKLLDLMPNTKVIIEVDIGNNIYTLESKVASNDYGMLLVAPIISKNQMLDFSMGIFRDAKYNLYAVTEFGTSRLQWKNVQIEMTKRKDMPFYKVSVNAFNSMANNANRRSNNRFAVNGRCTCTIVETGAYFPAEMVDVSVSGLAFSLKAGLPLMRVRMEVDFDDFAGGVSFSLHLKAQCIRIMPKDGAYLYGCQLSSSDQELLIYLSNKQEDLLRGSIERRIAQSTAMTDEEALRDASMQTNNRS